MTCNNRLAIWNIGILTDKTIEFVKEMHVKKIDIAFIKKQNRVKNAKRLKNSTTYYMQVRTRLRMW